MDILIIGMGYVGTTTGLVFAQQGHHVTGLDIDQQKIASLQSGNLYFYEPGLQEMLSTHIKNHTITFTCDAEAAIKNHDVIFITVGTPSLNSGKADLTYIKQAAEMIGRYKNEEKIVVIKSTVPIGTTDELEEWIALSSKDTSPVHMTMNPEFLREGNALKDALYPSRIVIGSQSDTAIHKLKELYKDVSSPVLVTSTKAAEMIKYASNAFLATKISFINEMARLCDKAGVPIQDVAKGMGLDERIGSPFLNSGLGYGGSCFPKDVKELIASAEEIGSPLHILQRVEEVNQTQSTYFMSKVKSKFPRLKGKRVAIFGLSFKPNTDDTRESVAFRMLEQFVQEEAKIFVHDPAVNLSTDWVKKGVTQCWDPYITVKEADLLVICTEWPQYTQLDWKRVKGNMGNPYLFDGRNMLIGEEMKKLGFYYRGIGSDCIDH
ncbi:UDP-glucose/GDP-mannose dehydrogenase family protein [Halobacillus sp. Marseille-P3879]|uniref:UDP-glucose dehydrogenase family protein n=1 Tax=Halobacillus sp. Marseille-P3879 TaxID=2045014 RepID=UPI000C7A30B1|nr:UDP-glucose/GDP-mannose dehydrogenase family protein [Halobacillus sp. Marseille-P3879]